MPAQIVKEASSQMAKAIEYFQKELRGIRTGRASTALLEFLKIEACGGMVDLRDVAAISVPEATQLLVKPFDPALKNGIAKSIEAAELGLNPQVEGESIRIKLPPPSADRRKQLATQVRKIAEETRIAIRNERRDAMKQIDILIKDKSNSVSEDQGKGLKSDTDNVTKKLIAEVDTLTNTKAAEIETL